MRILGISGSLRRGSHNTQLLREAAREFPPDVEFAIYDGLHEVPPYNEDDDGELAPDAVTRLRAALSSADAVLFSTPEYNFSIPGHLKNAIDWASRPPSAGILRYTPVAVIGASTGAYGAVWSQAELRKVLGSLGARVIEGEVALGHAHKYFDEGAPLGDETRGQLREVTQALVDEVRRRQDAAA